MAREVTIHDIPEVVLYRMALYGAEPSLIAEKAAQWHHTPERARESLTGRLEDWLSRQRTSVLWESLRSPYRAFQDWTEYVSTSSSRR